jgi:hypothetical protein
MTVSAAQRAKNTKNTKNTTLTADDVGNDTTALDQRYGRIGISAVAAAARYQGGAKNPAYAPAPLRGLTASDF